MEFKMKSKSDIKDLLKYNTFLSPFYLVVKELSLFVINKRFSDEEYLKRMFKKYQGYDLNLKIPKTLNEKLQWLKLNERKDFQTLYADKYAAREYIKAKFGEEWLIPLLFHTADYRDLKPDNMPECPFVIKTNHGFGNTVKVYDKNMIDWEKLRTDYKYWLKTNYYYFEREWQYKNIKPSIIIEKMILNKDGRLPNDYKLNFIEGNLEFIYVSVDREGKNKRNIYSPEWKPMYFTWARKGKDLSGIRGEEIEPPVTLPKMVEFGEVVAKLYKYVRVDFYDVDGRLYFGEITQCHGGGFDQMLPVEYDLTFGDKLTLPVMEQI
jgi:hypothetical protein